MLGAGSSLIGRIAEDARSCAKRRWNWRSKASCRSRERGEKPKEEKRSLFRELGLPYVSDPAVTRHLTAFLEPTGAGARRHPVQRRLLHPGDSAASAWRTWWGTGTARRPEIFENRDLDLAVAGGAAYYSYVRSTGSGVLVRGGLPRTYYIGLGEPQRWQVPGGVPGAARRRRRRRRIEIDSDDSATGGEPARVVPPVQLADAHRRQARRRGRVRRRRSRTCTCMRR